MRRLASIDIGSNTLRLLVAEQDSAGNLCPIQVERRITRLGQNFTSSRTLQPEAMDRSIAALSEFVDLMGESGVSHYLAGATAVVREASNGEHFLEMVEHRVGLEVRLLSGGEEANLSLLGVTSTIPTAHANTAVFDIGGGSTELIRKLKSESAPVESISLPLGAVHLTETFLQKDPPGEEACARLRRHVHAILVDLYRPSDVAGYLWIGTAGTVTTLASMHLEMDQYLPERINGVVLEKVWLTELCVRLANMTVARRSRLPGLEPGREDIILAGALLILEMMDVFDFSRFTVSNAGLLEGLFLDLCRSLNAVPKSALRSSTEI
jgi:exopolyphosphatase/guanosine-5'-triphosphate,3'-diphosphate pyrophosphatase